MGLTALDLYCGGGGAAAGLLNAGFERVVGIDIANHARNYPGEFIQADALRPPVDLAEFDLIWTSPPCQRWARSPRPNVERMKHPDLITPTRQLIRDHPITIIENVPPAPIRPDLKLTGPTVGLTRIERLRFFELSWYVWQPHLLHVPRRDWERGHAITITTSMSSSSHYWPRKRANLPGRVPRAEAAEAMGISHYMTCSEIGEAVAPPMAEYIGRAAIEYIRRGG